MRSRFLSVAAALAVGYASTTITANDERVTWMGRTVSRSDGGVTFDWEGTSLFFTIANASSVQLDIQDNTGSGSTFVVYMTGPSTGGQSLKVTTFPTAPGYGSYLISRGLSTDSITYQVKHNSEPCFMGTAPGVNLTVVSITTDGLIAATAPVLPGRKIQIIGDSITAGMGAGFNGPCDANIFQNSYDGTYTDILCRNLTAQCHVQAWSGIGVSCFYGDPNGQPCDPAAEYTQNMPNTFLYSIAAMRETGDASAMWDFSQYVPDMILINLGTNDWSGGRANNATFQAIYVQTYLQFITNITQVYYKRPALPLFLAMGPLSMAPLSAVQQVVAAWNAQGGKATLLPLPAPGLPIGCAGHPSPAMHAYMANTAIPVIQQVMGW